MPGSSIIHVAVIDSGVYAANPHIRGLAGGVSILPGGREAADYTDRLGHGTAVTAAICEKAPNAAIYAVKVFHESLNTQIELLVRAIDWSVAHGMQLINLSLGTANPSHETVLAEVLERARATGARLIAAYEADGIRWLPGSLPGAVGVAVDWECPRDECRTVELADGRRLYRASGFPRPVPGVPPERNLKGISFAVANVTGLLARDYCL